MPPPYVAAAQLFGNSLAAAFQGINGPATNAPSEVIKFNNLIQAFTAMGQAGFLVESYHGRTSQVEFDPAPPWTRPNPRCELSDLLFVTFNTTQLRISFLQAKSNVGAPIPFKLANTEQYVVLAQRPLITNWLGQVVWNDDVLRNAVLPSVGSFGIFCGAPGAMVDFHFLAANMMVPVAGPNLYKYVSGSFALPPLAFPLYRVIGQFTERTYCSSMIDFGAALYSLEIGSPIHHFANAANPQSLFDARSSLAEWATNELISSPNDPGLIALLNSGHFQGIQVQDGAQNAIGVKQVVLIRVPDNNPNVQHDRGG